MFEGKWGDYHLGRSCRLLNLYGDASDEKRTRKSTCIPVDPAVVLREAPVPKRIISLVSQTMDIFQNELQRILKKLQKRLIHRGGEIQHRLCHDTWALTAARLMAQRQTITGNINNYTNTNDGTNRTCIPASIAITLHTTRSFWERALCGPPLEFEICDTSATMSTQHSYHQQ